MIDVSRNYWFYLEPEVYCNIKENKTLMYNTSNGSRMIIHSDTIINLIKEINKDENYGSILLESEMLHNTLVISFIQETLEKQIGVIIHADNNTPKPIKPLPIFRLDNDIEKYVSRGDKYTGKNIIDNLIVVNLYVNNFCDTGCRGCNLFYKQVTCCFAHIGESSFISKEQIDNIASQISRSSVRFINIIGGNIFNYDLLSYLIDKFTIIGIEVNLWTHYFHIRYFLDNHMSAYINVLVTPSFLENDLMYAVSKLMDSRIKYHFLVESEYDINCVEKIMLKCQFNNFHFYPIFNGSNMEFFSKNVFMNKDDIFHYKISHRQIFANQKLNTNYFGVLNILPNGDVVADVNSRVIGNINSNKILELINKELLQNTTWRKVRDGQPCSNCLYQFICPSPSNYELIIGKNDLCHAFE